MDITGFKTLVLNCVNVEFVIYDVLSLAIYLQYIVLCFICFLVIEFSSTMFLCLALPSALYAIVCIFWKQLSPVYFIIAW